MTEIEVEAPQIIDVENPPGIKSIFVEKKVDFADEIIIDD